MASWLRYISRRDRVRAEAMAESLDIEELRRLAVRHVRRQDRFSYTFIPLSVLFAFATALSLYVPGVHSDQVMGGFTAIGAMIVPLLTVIRAQQVQQEGRVLSLAYYIREYIDENATPRSAHKAAFDTA